MQVTHVSPTFVRVDSGKLDGEFQLIDGEWEYQGGSCRCAGYADTQLAEMQDEVIAWFKKVFGCEVYL